MRTRRGCRSSAPLPRRVVTYARVQGFAKGAHPWLSSSRSSGAGGTTEVVPCLGGIRLPRYG